VARSYRSPLRESQALETRRRIIDNARALFVENGYAATTIAAVARQAGVSADTVYTSFGSKIALLREVISVVVGGDDQPVGILDREGPQAMRAEKDQRRQLAMFAHGMREQLERIRPLDDVLRSAAAVDPAAAELRTQVQTGQRLPAMRTIARWVRARGPLREKLSVDDAGSVIWTLTSPEVHRMLRDDCGWSADRYEQWLRETLTDSLLPAAPPPRGPSTTRRAPAAASARAGRAPGPASASPPPR
jgi:AcrR family transcriptional regulator